MGKIEIWKKGNVFYLFHLEKVKELRDPKEIQQFLNAYDLTMDKLCCAIADDRLHVFEKKHWFVHVMEFLGIKKSSSRK